MSCESASANDVNVEVDEEIFSSKALEGRGLESAVNSPELLKAHYEVKDFKKERKR